MLAKDLKEVEKLINLNKENYVKLSEDAKELATKFDYKKVILNWYENYLKDNQQLEESKHFEAIKNSKKDKFNKDETLEWLMYNYHRIGIITNKYFSSLRGHTDFIKLLLRELDLYNIKYVDKLRRENKIYVEVNHEI